VIVPGEGGYILGMLELPMIRLSCWLATWQLHLIAISQSLASPQQADCHFSYPQGTKTGFLSRSEPRLVYRYRLSVLGSAK
jgi:hypothetical protein